MNSIQSNMRKIVSCPYVSLVKKLDGIDRDEKARGFLLSSCSSVLKR